MGRERILAGRRRQRPQFPHRGHGRAPAAGDRTSRGWLPRAPKHWSRRNGPPGTGIPRGRGAARRAEARIGPAADRGGSAANRTGRPRPAASRPTRGSGRRRPRDRKRPRAPRAPGERVPRTPPWDRGVAGRGATTSYPRDCRSGTNGSQLEGPCQAPWIEAERRHDAMSDGSCASTGISVQCSDSKGTDAARKLA